MKRILPRAACALALLLPVSFAQAVAIDAKPGLWEQTKSGEAEKDFECLTADELKDTATWVKKAKKDIAKDCQLNNVKESAKALSFDYACAGAAGKGNGHMEIVFTTPTMSSARFKYDGSAVIQGKTMPFVFDIQQRSRWVSADCGEYADDDSEESP